MRKIYTIVATTCILASCSPTAKVTIPPTSGLTNFNNYLAIGSGYTAGAADNSLYSTSQHKSLPLMLFNQFQLVPASLGSRGYFVQPYLDGDDGYPTPKQVLAMTYPVCDSADSSLGPISFPNYIQDPIDPQPFVTTINNGEINNIGVPGIRVVDYPVQGYGSAGSNPLAYRFYHNTTGAGTPFDELLYRVNTLHPAFFTLWLGMDDILGYALGGGQKHGTGAVPVFLNYYSPLDISPIPVFEKNYDSILNASISTGAQGALISIPDVDSLPYFTAIPANGLMLTRQTFVDSMSKVIWGNATFNKVFQLGSNFFIIKDHNGNIRQAVPGERILLSAQQGIKCNGWGSITPIPDSLVLTTDELQYIRTTTQTFNAYIQQEAINHNLAFVDINSFLAKLYAGYTFNGITYSMQYISGGAFSLDGINMTPRGYALMANQVIQTINFKYHSTLPPVDVNSYLGISFP